MILSWFLDDTAQKVKFYIKYFFSKCDQILNEKLHFLCSAKVISCLAE